MSKRSPVSVVALSLALAALSVPTLFATAPAAAQEAEAGPTTAELLEQMKAEYATDRLPAAVAAKENQDPKLTGGLVKLLKDENFDVRSAAIEALGAREDKSARKSASKALCARLAPLAKDPDSAGEMTEICNALHELAQPSSVKPLTKWISADSDDELVEAALMAVANVPTNDAIEELISQMSKGRRRGPARGQRTAAMRALRYATGEDEGNDPDSWRMWWKGAKKKFDHEAAAARRAGQRQEDADREERKRKRREEKEKRGKKGKRGDGEGDGGKKKGDEKKDERAE